ncbi:hypothetical protein RchiOBHm_Chr5g0058381 [Rosa chinensis]|uniref:Encoded peptide n=1 Tax=Rosa chinensis TaxID=74649 RepID=A0A2P6QH54_ROSCH|nr:hypothetical protein RchiOBHm_Chr5g0058381 [Rosa chinensis]
MRFLAISLILMMMSSAFASRQLDDDRHGIRQLVQETKTVDQDGYPGTSVNNHHYIPRQDFNSKGGSDGGNGRD